MNDLLIYAVGYEARSGFVAQNVETAKRIALVFDKNKTLSFEANRSLAESRDDLLISEGKIEGRLPIAVLKTLEGLRSRTLGSTSPMNVAIDVSSMTRAMMSKVLIGLVPLMEPRRLTLTLFYAPGEYQEPPSPQAPFMDFGPVQGLEGWTCYPDHPISVILGLGYEVDQAIGAVEYLDPSGIWAFIPNGSDLRFRRRLEDANTNLWPIVDPRHRLEYSVTNPFRLYAELRGLAEAVSKRSRVVVVPGGPKIFSALAILVKTEVGDEVSVWRASAHDFAEVRDVNPNGEIVRFDYPRWRQVRPSVDLPEFVSEERRAV